MGIFTESDNPFYLNFHSLYFPVSFLFVENKSMFAIKRRQHVDAFPTKLPIAGIYTSATRYLAPITMNQDIITIMRAIKRLERFSWQNVKETLSTRIVSNFNTIFC